MTLYDHKQDSTAGIQEAADMWYTVYMTVVKGGGRRPTQYISKAQTWNIAWLSTTPT